MPFLSLPEDPAMLRFADGEVTFHYLLSTPSCQTFVHAAANAAHFESAPTGSTASRHRKRLSVGSRSSKARSRAASLVQSDGGAASCHKELELDPNYPIVFFLPSESFSCAHLFADQLADPELARRFNLVAIDPRGHGLTKDIPIRPDAQRGYDLDVKAADIATFIQRLCNRAVPGRDLDAPPAWSKEVHLLGCSMSGLVALRIASKCPDLVTSVMFTSPILELESEFMIESFQGIKELIEETWYEVHHGELAGTPAEAVKMPGEVVQGCTYRWAGDESIPHHISSYLNKTWVERLILHKDGNKAARDWWFDLYWLRSRMPDEARNAIRCHLFVVEGDSSPLYDRTVGGDYKALFPNCKSFEHATIEDAPFLLSVTRPDALTGAALRFLNRFGDAAATAPVTATATATAPSSASLTVAEHEQGPTVDEAVDALTGDERFQLIKVYAPNCLPSSDDDFESDDDDDEEDEGDDDEYEEQIEDDYLSASGDAGLSSTSTTTTTKAAMYRRDSSASYQTDVPTVVVDKDVDGGAYSSITMVTTVETFMSAEAADRQRQQERAKHLPDLVQSLEIGV
ncbi:uncharacterized protein PFL1_04873 [Pseudozyma flocculosa PF-1]|uniref:AB hydrolase-1 domain-containing protein n=2 Tax=Pseudozyma flocculosa TaxID=84751 RepID=A0A5C3F3P7_9BASI|nr:uncharacterized protein PFL1_04873 [Pseudozyma flocculosa PF-1]EPQ27736.1 hypothetical protein PFL1_04873 [Pseudozyma flocculosa PF-1]SPO39124.1 uncharacterized protein PSFLO_04603 [Pseudozyma flocculosa]